MAAASPQQMHSSSVCALTLLPGLCLPSVIAVVHMSDGACRQRCWPHAPHQEFGRTAGAAPLLPDLYMSVRISICSVSCHVTVLQAQTAAADPSPEAQQESKSLQQLLADVQQQLQQAQAERESLSERAQVSDMDRRELQAALDDTREQARKDVEELAQVCQLEPCLLLYVVSVTLHHCTKLLCILARHGRQH